MDEKTVMTPIKAIRKYCIECMEGHVKKVKKCVDDECPLYEFRMGKNPNITRNYSAEQLAKMRETMLEVRKKRKT